MGCQGRTRWGPHAAYYYRGVHGEATELWALLIQMLSTFLDAYREFHTWRRHTGEAVAAGVGAANREEGPRRADVPLEAKKKGRGGRGARSRGHFRAGGPRQTRSRSSPSAARALAG